MNGVPKEIVQRADELIAMALKGKDLIAACSIMPQSEVLELEEAVSYLKSPKTGLILRQEQIARGFLEVGVFRDPKKELIDILTISGTTESRSLNEQ